MKGPKRDKPTKATMNNKGNIVREEEWIMKSQGYEYIPVKRISHLLQKKIEAYNNVLNLHNDFKFPVWGGWSPPCHVLGQNQAGFQDIPSQSQARQNQTWKSQYWQFEIAILILIFETPLKVYLSNIWTQLSTKIFLLAGSKAI